MADAQDYMAHSLAWTFEIEEADAHEIAAEMIDELRCRGFEIERQVPFAY